MKQMESNYRDVIGSQRSQRFEFRESQYRDSSSGCESPLVMKCVRTDREDAFQPLRVSRSCRRPKASPARESLASASGSSRHDRHYTACCAGIGNPLLHVRSTLSPPATLRSELFFRQRATQWGRNYHQVCTYRCISVSCIVSHECYLTISPIRTRNWCSAARRVDRHLLVTIGIRV